MNFLAFVPIAAGAGAILGLLAARGHPFLMWQGKAAVLCLVAVAVVAAVMPNIGQSLYNVGLLPSHIDVVDAVSYFAFGFAIAASWVLLVGSWTRWALIALVPVSFAQPILWAYALTVWRINGFVP